MNAEQFTSIQRIVQRHRRPESRHRTVEDFPVRGLVRCPSCGWPLTAAWSRGRNRRYPYYLCFQRVCPARKRGYRAEIVHSEFSSALALTSLPKEVTGVAVEVLQAVTAERMRGATAAQPPRKELQGALQRQLSELLTLRTSRLISDEEFTKHRAQIATQLQEAQVDDNNVLVPLSGQQASCLVASLGDLDALWSTLPLDQRQAFGQCLFPAGYVFGQVRTAEKGLLIRVLGPSRDHLPKRCGPR